MNAITETELSTEIDSHPIRDRESCDQSLGKLRATRRLEQVASGIERFLMGQFTRLDKALSECERAANHDQVVQQMILEFDEQRKAWEEQREQEAERLRLAYEKMMEAWRMLEEERRMWLEEQDKAEQKGRRA